MVDLGPTNKASTSSHSVLRRAWKWFNEQSFLVQVATGIVLFLIIGGPTATVIVASNGGSSKPTATAPTTSRETPTTRPTTKLLKDKVAESSLQPNPQTSFAAVDGQPLLNAVGIDAVRDELQEVDYDVTGYSRFTATIGIAINNGDNYGTYRFEILTDDTPAYTHQLRPSDPPVEVTPPISLTGVRRLKLIVTTSDGPLGPGGVMAVFANAQLS